MKQSMFAYLTKIQLRWLSNRPASTTSEGKGQFFDSFHSWRSFDYRKVCNSITNSLFSWQTTAYAVVSSKYWPSSKLDRFAGRMNPLYRCSIGSFKHSWYCSTLLLPKLQSFENDANSCTAQANLFARLSVGYIHLEWWLVCHHRASVNRPVLTSCRYQLWVGLCYAQGWQSSQHDYFLNRLLKFILID